MELIRYQVAKLEKQPPLIGGLPQTEGGAIDFGRDFFSCPSYLTVSGQLQVETFCQTLVRAPRRLTSVLGLWLSGVFATSGRGCFDIGTEQRVHLWPYLPRRGFAHDAPFG